MEPHAFDKAGAIQSPVDHRDFTTERIAMLGGAGIPTHQAQNQNGPLIGVPVFYQGQTPACVAHSVAWAYLYKHYLENKTQYPTSLSPRFLYALCKANDGVPNEEGTYPRTALQQLQGKGICPDIDYPNTITLPLATYQSSNLIPAVAYTDAKPISGDTYVSVGIDVDSIKNAIDQYGSVLLLLGIDGNWWTAPNGQTSWAQSDILPIRPPKVQTSGHQVCVYGYDEKYLYFANSFGSTWGDNGYGWLDPIAYKRWFKEAWSITSLTPQVIAELKQAAQTLQQQQQTAQTKTSEAWIDALLAWLESL